MADAFPLSGQIDAKAFPFLVVHLHRGGATGSLKVEGASYHKALYFRAGRILFGSSNDPRDQLGAILIEGGKITPEQLEDVNGKVGPGNPLAKVLADTGFVSQRELSEAARAKVERILSDVLVYTAGTFEFEDGVLPKGAVDLKLSTERIIMAAVRRVSDRNFVLRHIGGLDAVLGPTAEMVPRLTEIQTEAGGLPDHLDGRRTLKDAAARTRLDEFEAAKVACGLLFLGLVERVPSSVTASAAEAVTFADVDANSELDLGATAAQAFVQPPVPPPAAPAPAAAPPPPPAPEEEPAPFVIAAEAEPSPSFDFSGARAAAVTPEAEPEPAAPTQAPPPPRAEPAPVPPSPPLVAPARPPEPAASPPPPAAASPPTPPRSVTPTSLPLVMPEPRRPTGGRAPSVPSPPPPGQSERLPRAARPSKDDLAALDALLNSRTFEGSATSLDKPASEVREHGSFSSPRPRGGRRTRSDARRPALLVAAFLLLAVAAGAWYYRLRSPEPGARVAAATPATMARAVSRPPGTVALVPSAPPTTALPTAASPRAVAATPAPRVDGSALLRAGRYPDAARAFAQATRAAGKGSAVIQLLVACSTDTVQKAVESASSPELFILPVSLKGRECYRLCWGLYPSEGRAASALRGVPEYFRQGGANPKVVGASEVVP